MLYGFALRIVGNFGFRLGISQTLKIFSGFQRMAEGKIFNIIYLPISEKSS